MHYITLLFSGAFRRSGILTKYSSYASLTQVQPPSLSVVTEARKNVFDNVNDLLKRQCEGRLFAVVHLCGKQFKVTAGDIILVEGYWPPATGDKIRLDKVSFVRYFIVYYIQWIHHICERFCLLVVKTLHWLVDHLFKRGSSTYRLPLSRRL